MWNTKYDTAAIFISLSPMGLKTLSVPSAKFKAHFKCSFSCWGNSPQQLSRQGSSGWLPPLHISLDSLLPAFLSYSHPVFLFPPFSFSPANALGNLLVSTDIIKSHKWTFSLNSLLLTFCLVKSSQHLGTSRLFSSRHLQMAHWSSPLFSVLWLGDFSEANDTIVYVLFVTV